MGVGRQEKRSDSKNRPVWPFFEKSPLPFLWVAISEASVTCPASPLFALSFILSHLLLWSSVWPPFSVSSNLLSILPSLALLFSVTLRTCLPHLALLFSVHLLSWCLWFYSPIFWPFPSLFSAALLFSPLWQHSHSTVTWIWSKALKCRKMKDNCKLELCRSYLSHKHRHSG